MASKGNRVATKKRTPVLVGCLMAAVSFLAPAGAHAAGKAPAIAVSPAAKDFGSLAIGTTSPAASFVIANKGRTPLRVSGISLAGAAGPDFTLAAATCATASLAVGARCTFRVAFAPKGAGKRVATAVVSSNDPGRPKVSVALVGTGVAPPPPALPEGCDVLVDGSAANPGDGSVVRPWQTIQEAADQVVDGKNICIRGGVYEEQVSARNSGSAGLPIVFASYPGETAVIDGTRVASRPGSGPGLFIIENRHFITLSGLRIVDGFDAVGGERNGVLVRDASNVVLTRVEVRDAGWAGIFVFRSSVVTVAGSSTFNTRSSGIYVDASTQVVLDGNDVQRAVNGGSQECISIVSVAGFEVRNNAIHNGAGLLYGGEGIDVKMGSAHGKVYNNRVYDLPAGYDPGVHRDGEIGIYVDAYSAGNPDPVSNPDGVGPLHDIEVFNNTVSTPVGIAVAAEQGGLAENIRIYNNVVRDAHYDGILVSDCCDGNEGMKRNVEIVNNTVYRCGAGYGGGITVRAMELDGLWILNNIAAGNTSWQLRDKSGGAVAANNLIDGYRSSSQEILGDNCIEADPGFRDPLAGDFRLGSLSAAIDGGHRIPGRFQPSFDRELKQRNDGLADIGAYEF